MGRFILAQTFQICSSVKRTPSRTLKSLLLTPGMFDRNRKVGHCDLNIKVISHPLDLINLKQELQFHSSIVKEKFSLENYIKQHVITVKMLINLSLFTLIFHRRDFVKNKCI